MTIQEIFDRYDVSESVQQEALSQAAFIKDIQTNWVGIQLDWRALIIAALFYDLGSDAISTLVRKKVGVDKFVVNVMSRAVVKRMEDVIDGYDWYQKILLVSALYRYNIHITNTEKKLLNQIEESVINPLHMVQTEVSPSSAQAILALDIKHYKNPSV